MKDEAEDRLKSMERPKGILEYRQLLDIAARDKLTLQRLENDFRELNIEEARLEDPWELITNPTLSSPLPRYTIMKSLLVGITGFFLSYIYFLILDIKRENSLIR